MQTLTDAPFFVLELRVPSSSCRVVGWGQGPLCGRWVLKSVQALGTCAVSKASLVLLWVFSSSPENAYSKALSFIGSAGAGPARPAVICSKPLLGPFVLLHLLSLSLSPPKCPGWLPLPFLLSLSCGSHRDLRILSVLCGPRPLARTLLFGEW